MGAEVERIDIFATEKIESQQKFLEDFDIRITEAEDILKDKADETEKIYKTITDLGVKLGKEKSETLTIITQQEEDLISKIEKVQKVMSKMDNNTNNKLGQMQKLMQDGNKKLVENVDAKTAKLKDQIKTIEGKI